MKLNILRETLLRPLQMVIGVVERKQTLPILSYVLLDIKGNNLSVTGTDLEVELIGQATMGQKADKETQFTLPGRKLIDIFKALPESAPVELFEEKDRIVLKSGRSRFTLATLPTAEFPNVEHKDKNINIKVEQGKLKQLLQRTAFAMAQQDVRYYLNGLMLEVSKDGLTAVATDGHRLASNIIDISVDESHRIQIIIPRKGVMELLRLLEDNDETVDITIGNNHIRVTGSEYTFTSKLIEGRFPDYERVIPKNADKIVSVEREVLRQALNRTAILCNEKFHGVRFELRKNLLRLHANNPEQEAAEEELQIEYQGPDMDIGFNVNYLVDVLNTLKSDEVKLLLIDSNSSMRIDEHEGDTESIFVVMPMRL